MIKKIITYIFTAFFLLSIYSTSLASLNPEDIKPDAESIMSGSGGGGTSLLDSLLEFAADSVFGLLGLIAIGMFLFIGGRLFVARGNPEEFKKAMMSLVYAIIGIFVVIVSWALVKFIAGINI